MASLLSKFRIDYSDLKVIPDITRKPLDSTMAYFKSLIQPVSDDNINEGIVILLIISFHQ